MPPNSVILEATPLTWRGETVPCSGLDTEFEHRLAERVYYRVDAAGHEPTGLQPVRTSATLHFLNTIDPSLYPGKWQTYRKLLTDGTPGDLKHPDLGRFFARVSRFRFRMSPQSSAGISVDVEWVQSLKDVETPVAFDDSKAGAKAAAQKADKALQALNIPYPDGMAENDFFGAIQSVFDTGFSVMTELNGEVNKITGQIDEVQNSLDRVIGAAYSNALSAAERDPIVNAVERWVLEDSLLQLRAILLQTVKDAAQGSRAVATHTTSRAVDAATLAAELSADLGSILSLNPSAASRPVIPKGTQIKYYAA